MGSLPRRFWERVEITDGCWLWRTPQPDGYGRFQIGWQRRRAHVWAYEWAKGAIPDGLIIDHICRVRSCVNPAHLRAVDSRTNTLAEGSQAVAKKHASKTECPQGHEYDRIDYKGARRCSVCDAEAKRAYKARKRAA
jgi:hypothetical protein